MRVCRNGMIIELTPDELREAAEEHEFNSAIDDINQILDEGFEYKDYDMADISDELIEKMARVQLKILSENDAWRYASENAIQRILDEQKK